MKITISGLIWFLFFLVVPIAAWKFWDWFVMRFIYVDNAKPSAPANLVLPEPVATPQPPKVSSNVLQPPNVGTSAVMPLTARAANLWKLPDGYFMPQSGGYFQADWPQRFEIPEALNPEASVPKLPIGCKRKIELE